MPGAGMRWWPDPGLATPGSVTWGIFPYLSEPQPPDTENEDGNINLTRPWGNWL